MSLDRFFRSRNAHRLPKPTLSIGNLTVGGTGKTPLVIRLAQDLEKKKCHVGVLARGYKGFGETSVGGEFNDELTLIKEKCPNVLIGVGPNRVASAEKILSSHAVDIFILDDGFQHWSIQRDCDVVCIDATNPFDEGWLLPAGRLREPMRALHRANFIVITRTELITRSELIKLQEKIREVAPEAAVLISFFEFQLVSSVNEILSNEPLRDKTVVALSSIGNPGAFENNLKSVGANVVAYRLPDHASYNEELWEKISALAEKLKAVIVTTEKDWVKAKSYAEKSPQVKVLRLAVQLKFESKDELIWSRLIDIYAHEKN